MERVTCDKIISCINNSISITEKLIELPSPVQSRGLPVMAPIYRIPKDRKRFTYLSYYPKMEDKPTNNYPLGVEKTTRRFSSNIIQTNSSSLPSLTQRFKIPETPQRPKETSFLIKPYHPNFYQDNYDDILQKSKKTHAEFKPKKEEILEPAHYTYVYHTWPEPKGYCPKYILKKFIVPSKNHRSNLANPSK